MTWIPEEEALRSFALKVDEISVSRLFIDDAQRKAAFEHATDEAAEAYFTPQRRVRYARRLREMAHVLASEGRLDAARTAVAVSRDLSGEEGARNAFCRALFGRALEGRWQKPADSPAPPASRGGIRASTPSRRCTSAGPAGERSRRTTTRRTRAGAPNPRSPGRTSVSTTLGSCATTSTGPGPASTPGPRSASRLRTGGRRHGDRRFGAGQGADARIRLLPAVVGVDCARAEIGGLIAELRLAELRLGQAGIDRAGVGRLRLG